MEGELAEKAAEPEQRRQGEEEQVVYCAVGKEADRQWKANLLWVLANLPRGKRLVFLHLHRPASRINMMGAWVPVSQLAEQEVTAYKQLEEEKIGKVLDDLLDICKSQKVNASKIIISSDDTARGLVQFVDDHGVTELVMGAASDRAYHRKMRAPRSKKALMVQRRANPSCKIWFVCKGNLICTRDPSEGWPRAESSTTGSTSPRSSVSDYSRSKSSPRLHSETLGTQESSEVDHIPPTATREANNAMDRDHEATGTAGWPSKPSTSEAVVAPDEEPSGDEEEQGIPSPDDGWDDLLYEKLQAAMMEAENLKREAYEETRRRQMAERDLAEANKMADEAERWYERELKQRKEVEEMLARERSEMERDKQELQEMVEQMQKVEDRSAELEFKMAGSDRTVRDLEARLAESYTILHMLRPRPERPEEEEEEEEEELEEIRGNKKDSGGEFRRFGYVELEEATNHFDESFRIDGGGDGGRGKVYRGRLRDMAVAVKVFRPDVAVDEARFTRGAEAIGRRRHPGLVALVGACPEARAVVYELLPGARSLEEQHLDKLPWHVRCGVAYRTCSALAFLHSSARTVHGDVRPANILLLPLQGGDTSSKLGGLGTRRLVHHPLPGAAAGVAYADPQYLATPTGELTPHCDVYSFGVLLLRLLTGMPPFLARKDAQEAAAGTKQWHHVLDLACGWPVHRAMELALVALKCCCGRKPRTGDGDMTMTLLVLEEARSMLEDAISAAAPLSDAPSYFLCPILKEVMRDPQIAADGYSYEAEAIKEWLRTGHDTSPMTNLKLPTLNLTPNHALRSAIHQWRQRQSDR